MASINEMRDLLRPIIDEATARAAFEGEIHPWAEERIAEEVLSALQNEGWHVA